MKKEKDWLTIEFNRLRSLVSLKNETDEQLLERARQKVKIKETAEEFVDGYKSSEENKYAVELALKYLNDYQIETVSDRSNLKEVIRLEVIQTRLHNKLNEAYEKSNGALSTSILDALTKNGEAIRKQKEALGLNRSKEKIEAYDAYQSFRKRAKKWEEENQMSLTHACPHCQQMILFKLRNEVWEAKKHPFFKDKLLYNVPLFEKYYGQTVEVNDAFIAEVLGASQDFPGWVREKRNVKSLPDVSSDSENKSPVIDITIQPLESDSTEPDLPDNEG